MVIVHDQPGFVSPLGRTHGAFVRAFVAAGQGAAPAASAAYTRFFREGPGAFPVVVPAPARVLVTDSPEGQVTKFLLPVAGPERDGIGRPQVLETESVIIPMKRGAETTHTLCVSSQVGCAMGCAFCETAQMGLLRSLRAEEIVAQWYAAARILGHRVRNIVFMGMGEPLDNLDEVLRAIEVLTDNRGPAVAMRRISVSTVGRTDGLRRLREAVQRTGWRALNLAVSINAPNDEIRSRIMPVNRAMPLGELVPILEEWPLRAAGAICCEYVLIPGVNNRPEHAAELAALLRGVRCCVNVIPYNPRRDSPWPAPEEADVGRFLADLESHGQFCKRRRTKGRDTMAACGQLGNAEIRGRRLVGLSLNGARESA